MSRTKQKARKKGNARDILRDRTHDLPTSRQQDPPSSEQPASACSPRVKIPMGTRIEQKAQHARQRLAKRIQARAALMKTRPTSLQDLRHVDSDELGEHCTHLEAHHASQDFRVLFFVGFLGYGLHGKGCRKMVKIESFHDLTTLAEMVMKLLRPQFHTVLGLEEEMYKVAGYEIRFPEDYVCGDIVIEARQPVLVQSEYLLSAWAEQVYQRRRDETAKIVVRIAKPGGTIFDPTFRTSKEGERKHQATEIAKQAPPTSEQLVSIKHGRRDDPVSTIVNKRQKAQLKRETKQQRRRGEPARPDTDVIETLMERQHLSDDAANITTDGTNISFEGLTTAKAPCYVAEQDEMAVD